MKPLSGVFRESWAMYRAHAARLLSLALVVYAVVGILQFVLAAGLGRFGLLLAAVLTFVAVYLLQAALVKAVADVRAGRPDVAIGDTLAAARPVLGPVIGASVLAGIAIGIGLILLIVPGLWLLTIWCVIVPVIVLERTGVSGSFSRSRDLVRGHGWEAFGVLVGLWLVHLAVSIVVSVVLLAASEAVREGLGTFVAGTLVAPFQAIVLTMIYYRLLAAHSGAQPAEAQYR